MRRREFITLLGGAAATWPLAARARQPQVVRSAMRSLKVFSCTALAGVALKPFDTIAVAIFTVIALVHLHRLFDGWEIVIAGFHVPVW